MLTSAGVLSESTVGPTRGKAISQLLIMGQFFDELTPSLLDWIQRQHMFFVATAPLKTDGHINVSPKGIQGTFHTVNSKRVWYEDLWGSGSYTSATRS